MAQQTINIGAAANDGTGDQLRDAFDKVNDNFTDVYAIANGAAPIKATAPTVAIGEAGDTAGMIAYDASFIYVCTADYDGATSIWIKSAVTAW